MCRSSAAPRPRCHSSFAPGPRRRSSAAGSCHLAENVIRQGTPCRPPPHAASLAATLRRTASHHLMRRRPPPHVVPPLCRRRGRKREGKEKRKGAHGARDAHLTCVCHLPTCIASSRRWLEKANLEGAEKEGCGGARRGDRREQHLEWVLKVWFS
jgi:hypothetical protein